MTPPSPLLIIGPLFRVLLLACLPAALLAASDPFPSQAEAVLNAMQATAAEHKATGVAVLLFSADGGKHIQSASRIIGRAHDAPAENRPGANLLAIAYAKACEMFLTARPSGHPGRPTYLGEVGWPGGVVLARDGHLWCVAFSGAPSDVDLAISRAGLARVPGAPERE